jgi:ferredoxin/flavodoxin---NADP+ reductase
MRRILMNREIAKDIHEFIVEAPEIAACAKPGHFVIVMADDKGERVPLTIADFDRSKGTLTLVLMAVGTSTRKLASLPTGGKLYALAGPLGVPSEIEKVGTIVCVAGGVGVAPVYPIARALKEAGNRVICIQGSRTKDLLFWTDKLASVSDRHILVTDDGTAGTKGLVTAPLDELLKSASEGPISRIWAIGPPPMMRACVETTRPYSVKTFVSLNTLMVDGTGMCGGCRVDVGGEILFTCVQGPEFDGHKVDWSLFFNRQKVYHALEQCSLEKYIQERGAR